MELTFLGTGTSHGIPVIGCDCPVCTSSDKRNNRLRSSVLITDKFKNKETNILVDCGPEFRIQCLKNNIKHIDMVLLTHSHADHLHGIDDLRVFACARPKNDPKKSSDSSKPLQIFANSTCIKDFKIRFDYLFKPVLQGGGRAFVSIKSNSSWKIEKPFEINGMKIFAIPMLHGTLKTSGYVFQKISSSGKIFKTIAYLTDVSKLPPSSIKMLQSFNRIDHLIIDGLRPTPHSTHFSFAQALDAANKINPRNVWLTHLCHNSSHEDCIKWIEENITNYPNLQKAIKKGGSVAPAFDGLKL